MSNILHTVKRTSLPNNVPKMFMFPKIIWPRFLSCTVQEEGVTLYLPSHTGSDRFDYPRWALVRAGRAKYPSAGHTWVGLSLGLPKIGKDQSKQSNSYYWEGNFGVRRLHSIEYTGNTVL